jgi:outer membrane protein assembly factor BamB
MSLQPAFLWSFLTTDTHFEQPILWTPNQVAAVSTDGRFSSFNKVQRLLRYEYHFRKDVVAPMGQHEVMAYVGSLDFNVYALNMASGKLIWRFLSGAPVRRQPAVNDEAVYAVAEREGMYCLDRESGADRWLNRDADRFLAANTRFVYAADRIGELLVLDHLRGRSLARLPMREYNVPVMNEFTDRIYFASHDGQIVCLRHRDLTLPARMKSNPWQKPKAEPAPNQPAQPAAVGAQ